MTIAADHQLFQPFIEYGALITRLLRRADSKTTETVALETARHVHALIVGGSVAGVVPRFTARESIVLALLRQGLSLRDIATDIHVSVNTVKTHVKAIYRKLGVNNRLDAVKAWNASFPSPES